jgi:hypothetical protein
MTASHSIESRRLTAAIVNDRRDRLAACRAEIKRVSTLTADLAAANLRGEVPDPTIAAAIIGHATTLLMLSGGDRG